MAPPLPAADPPNFDIVASGPAPDLVSGDFHDDLGFAITGGTGRFHEATGAGRLTAHGNIYEFPTIVSSRLKGTIATHPH